MIAKISAKVLELLPNPLLTQDQLILLKYDNIKSGLYKTNNDLGIMVKINLKQKSKNIVIIGDQEDNTQKINLYDNIFSYRHLFNFISNRNIYSIKTHKHGY